MTDHIFSCKNLVLILLFHLPNVDRFHIQLLCYWMGLLSRTRSHNLAEKYNYRQMVPSLIPVSEAPLSVVWLWCLKQTCSTIPYLRRSPRASYLSLPLLLVGDPASNLTEKNYKTEQEFLQVSSPAPTCWLAPLPWRTHQNIHWHYFLTLYSVLNLPK